MEVRKRIRKSVDFGELDFGVVFRISTNPTADIYMSCKGVVGKGNDRIYNAVSIESGELKSFNLMERVFVVDGEFVER